MKDQSHLPLDQTRLQQSFCRGLETYHQHARVQEQIAKELIDIMQEQGVPKSLSRVLEFGCGTGHLTEALLKGFELGSLTLNDLVPEMASPLSSLLQRAGRVADFRFGPVETLALPKECDLITSASTVQWIEDLPGLLSRLVDHLAPSGWLALSSFGRGQFHELQALGSAAAAPSYLDQEEWQHLLPDGLERISFRQRRIQLHFDSGLDLLRHLRRTGVNGQAGRSWARSDLTAFEAEYRRCFGTKQGLPLTYDAVWVLARKSAK